MDSGSGNLLTMYDEILNILYIAAKVFLYCFRLYCIFQKSIDSISDNFYFADFPQNFASNFHRFHRLSLQELHQFSGLSS